MALGEKTLLRREIDPHEIFRVLFQSWYWLIVAMLIGGLIGLGITRLRPPRYQASAVLRIDLVGEEYHQLGWTWKRDILSPVRVLLLGDETLMQTLASQGKNGDERSAAELREDLRLNDLESEWFLGAIHTEPDEAAHIANAWSSIALSELEETTSQATRAAKIAAQLETAGCVLRGAHGAAWDCPPEWGGVEVASLIEQWESAFAASHGIPPELEFELIREATAPRQPIYWGRGAIILSASLLGGVVGVGIVLATAPPKRELIRHRGSA